MDLKGWNDRYLSRERAAEDYSTSPTALLVQIADRLPPGDALDLACGTGRNALWLASRGWRVTAVDGAEAAVAIVREHAAAKGLPLVAVAADLEAHAFPISPLSWDLIVTAYYLQRDLFAKIQEGVRPGGTVLAIAHITEEHEQPTAHRLRPGELAGFFDRWEIDHYCEGKPRDDCHRRSVAELAARRPLSAVKMKEP